VFLNKSKLIHVGFNDPLLAKEANSEQEALHCYLPVRDEILDFVREKLPSMMSHLK